MKILKTIAIILLFLTIISIAYAQEKHDVTIYFFYGDGCPHCAEAEPFLESLENKYPELTVRYYETWNDKENAALFIDMSAACGTKVVGVPTFFIGHKPIVGFDSLESKGKEIEAEVIRHIRDGGVDLMDHLGENLTSCPSKEQESVVTLPIIGKIDTSKISLPVFTIIIGLLDGFNPCAMWVLCFLLTLLIYAKSRKKMLFIGSIFVFTSGLVYFFFMAAWLNFFLMIGFVRTLRVIIALVAVVVGLVNIKDFFFFKKGVSFTIPDKWKPKLFEKMRNLLKKETLLAIIIGTVVLAFTANAFELMCTFGLPAIYTRTLTMHNLSTLNYYFYLMLYNIVYVLPLAVIVLVFTWTMGAHRFTDKHGRILKLVSGLLMLLLGLILLLRPEILAF